MQMSIDAALITRKSASLDYNTDSLNASGKIWPRESVHSANGIKAVGKSHGKPYYVLSSADAKGTAESAADLFKACVSEFATDGTNYSESISEFFRAFAGVLDKSGYNSASCDLAIFAGVENRVFLAKSGKARLFRYSEGFFSEAKPQMFAYEDQASNYGVCSYSDAQVGDIYVLLSGKVGAAVSESLLKAIVKNADGDIKKMVSQIDSNAKKNGCADAISAIVLKVTDIEGDENDAAPAVGAVSAAAASSLREADLDEAEDELYPEDAEADAIEEEPVEHRSHTHSHRIDYYDPSEDEIDHEAEETEKINRYKSRNKFGRAAVIDIVIVLAVIIVLVVVLAMKGVFKPKSDSALKEGGDIVNITSEKETTKKNKKNKKDETTKKSETTTAAETTKKNSSAPAANPGDNNNNNRTTRSSSRPVTQAPATQTPVTQAPPATDAPEPVTEAPPATDPPAPVTDPPAPVTDPPAPVTDPPAPVDPDFAD